MMRKPRVKCLLRRSAHGVDGLPGDEHGHDGGLARAGRELERDAMEFEDWRRGSRRRGARGSACRLVRMRRDFGKPDGSLNRFDLTEERADSCEVMMPPMLKQAGGFRRNLP